MPQIIEVKGIGQLQFPDDMNDDQIAAAIKSNLADLKPTQPADDKFQSREYQDPNFIEKIGGGAVHGLTKAAQGIKQLGLIGGEALGLAPQGAADNYTKQVDKENANFDKTPLGQSKLTNWLDWQGQAAPYVAGMAVGGVPALSLKGAEGLAPGLIGNILKSMGKGAAANAGIGALQYVPDGGSRALNTFMGGLLGAFAPAAGSAAQGATNFIRKPESYIAEKALQGIDPEVAIKTKEAANKLGLNLTPAEASGSPYAAQQQGKLGTSPKGAMQLFEFGQNRLNQEKNIINDFLNNVSKDASPAASDIRYIAKNAITGQEKALQKAAEPYYKAAERQVIPEEKLVDWINLQKEPIIARALKRIDEDPIYKNELKGYPTNSIKVMDLVKRNIDDEISGALRAGEKNKARLLKQSKNELVSTMDKVSEDYKTARTIYSDNAPGLDKLKESNLGRLSELKDTQLKNVSKIIFDPSQTDIKVLNQMRNTISKQSPETWNRIVRNEMERRLDSTDVIGTGFYSKILKSDRSFNQFVTALKDNPQAQEKLILMRSAFKNLINPRTVKTAAGQAKSSLDVPRSSVEAAGNAIKNFLGGKYDKAAIDLITSNKWDRQFNVIKKTQDIKLRNQKIANLLATMSTVESANVAGDIFKKEPQ